MLNIPDIPGVYKEKIYEKTWFKVSMGTLAGAAVMFGVLRGCAPDNHDNNGCDDEILTLKKEKIELETKIIELQDSVAVYKDAYLMAADSLQACHKRCPVAKKTAPAPKKTTKKTSQKAVEKHVVVDHVVKRDSVVVKPNKDTVAQAVVKDTTSKSGVVHHTITQSDVVVYTIQYGRGK
ncbi:MAG: hypothetical protein KBS86_01905 [Proteobacteria bacterium]|nr:hypothetical protein [Candidatus Enterousia scatequi]